VAVLLAQAGHGGPCAARTVEAPPPQASRDSRPPRSSGRRAAAGSWARFQISWGSQHGADPRRLLAVVCRRGGISSGEVGLIQVGERSSMVEVTERVASEFARSASRPDPRDPRIKIREWRASR
jgi:ATP-dependent RNA helicase DeaD